MPPKRALQKMRETFPWMRKGYKVLDRFDRASPVEGDRKVLEQMLAHGADFSKERHVVHYFYFPDDGLRNRAEASLNSRGYSTREGIDCFSERPISLIAERHGFVDATLVSRERELLTSIAEDCDGEYDGWEAALD